MSGAAWRNSRERCHDAPGAVPLVKTTRAGDPRTSRTTNHPAMLRYRLISGFSLAAAVVGLMMGDAWLALHP